MSGRIGDPPVQWTNARLTQRTELAQGLRELVNRYEQDSWISWDWTEEAEALMRRLGLL